MTRAGAGVGETVLASSAGFQILQVNSAGGATISGLTVNSTGAERAISVTRAEVEDVAVVFDPGVDGIYALDTGVDASFSAAVAVRDTLITLNATTGQAGLVASDSGNGSTRTSTLLAERGRSWSDLMTVSVRDSVMTGVDHPLYCAAASGRADVTTSWSSCKDTGNVDNCAVGDVVESDGDCTPRRDVGPFEHQRTAPVVAGTAPATVVAAAQASFTSAGSCTTEPGDAMTVAWDFGDGTTSTQADQTEPPAGGGSTGSGTTGSGTTGEAAPPVAGTARTSGVNSTPGPGTGGATEADARLAMRVQQPAARDRVAPRITKLRLRAGRLTFRLSEAAKVTVRAGRRTIRVRGRAGLNRLRVRGARRLRITATDAAGNATARRLRLR